MIRIQDFLPWFTVYAQNARTMNERRLVVLSGSESWALSLLNSTRLLSIKTKSIVYGDTIVFKPTVEKKRYRDCLGSESDAIIFIANDFNIDAFAVLSGTLKAGGILFLITPPTDNKLKESLFLKRFNSLIAYDPTHIIIDEAQTLPLCDEINLPIKSPLTSTSLGSCKTKEQYNAVLAIKKVLSGHRKRPLVLTADRGRGKSSALAIACAQLMKDHQNDDFKIVITAPDIQALSIFYYQLKQSLTDTEKKGNSIIFGRSQLTFVPVDELIKTPMKINLLLVDEAAAIPIYLLEKLLNHYHRIVFSSTVHGYEGAGRGFTLKFQKTLDKLCPKRSYFHINQPIRWRENDPLEKFVFDACLLNAELTSLNIKSSSQLVNHPKRTYPINIESYEQIFIQPPIFQIVSAKKLIENDKLLQQIFAILVTAHYQTKPSDLQLLLDNNQIQIACLCSSNNESTEVLAVALLMNEGKGQGISHDDIKLIKNSERRLRNHFLPQSLFNYCGFEQAFNYRYLRVMRIAVHPQVQNIGLGLKFLHHIELFAKEQAVDFIGASFGANADLLSFWLNAGFSTARVGFTKDKSSGEHSALLIKGVGERNVQQQHSFSRDFYQSFDYLLLEEHKTLATELVLLLLSQATKDDIPTLSEKDWKNVQAFSRGERVYSSCCYSLYLWLKQDLLNVNNQNPIKKPQYALLLVARLMQKHSISTVCQQFNITGKKMLNEKIKEYVNMRCHEIS